MRKTGKSERRTVEEDRNREKKKTQKRRLN